jgi:hypothetical protein
MNGKLRLKPSLRDRSEIIVHVTMSHVINIPTLLNRRNQKFLDVFKAN